MEMDITHTHSFTTAATTTLLSSFPAPLGSNAIRIEAALLNVCEALVDIAGAAVALNADVHGDRIVYPKRRHVEHFACRNDRFHGLRLQELWKLLRVNVRPVYEGVATAGMLFGCKVNILALARVHKHIPLVSLQHRDHVAPTVVVCLRNNTRLAKPTVDATCHGTARVG